MASYPTDVRYTDKHAWVRPREKMVTLGLTEHAAEQVGRVGFVELPYPGELFKAGALIGRISGDTSSAPLYMPFTGQIHEINKTLADAPASINSDPYGSGWVLRIEPGDLAEVEALMDAAGYEAFVSAGGDA